MEATTDRLRRILAAIAGAVPFDKEVIAALNDAAFCDALSRHGLTSLVYPSLGDARARLSEEAGAYLRKRYEDALIHKTMALQLLQELRPVLCAGSKAVLLQGIALLDTIYREPQCREMSDIDLFLPGGIDAEVPKFLAAKGFSPFENSPHLWYRRGLCLDLHEGLWGEDRLDKRRYTAPPIEPRFVASAMAQGYALLCPAHLAIHCALHGLKHAFQRDIWTLDMLMLHSAGYFDAAAKHEAGAALLARVYLRDRGLLDAEGIAANARGLSLRARMQRRILACARTEGAGEILLALQCRRWPQSFAYFAQSLVPPVRDLRRMYGNRPYPRLLAARLWSLLKIVIRKFT